MIFFNHGRRNLSSSSSSVKIILHSSTPYSRAGSILLWNKPSFVFQLYDSDFHTFPRILKEFLAFESLFPIRASVPPSFVSVDPRQVYSSVTLICDPKTFILSCLLAFIFMTFVILALVFRPTNVFLDQEMRRSFLISMFFFPCMLDINAVTSSNTRSLIAV